MAEHDMAGRKSQTYDRKKTSGRGLGDDCARFMVITADDRRITLLSRLLRTRHYIFADYYSQIISPLWRDDRSEIVERV